MAVKGLPILRQALPLLEAEEERELIAGLPYTRELLVRHNLPLVMKIAAKHAMYAGRTGDLDLLNDLVQEGVEGFLHGLEKFDVARENKLSTYVIWWIEQRVRRYLESHLRLVRLPVHLNEKIRRVQQGKSTVEQETNSLSLQSVMRQLLSQTTEPEISLDSLLRSGNEEGREFTWYNRFPAPSVEVDERLERERLLTELRAGLTTREFEILWRRAKGEVLAQIADSLGVTRERVRQIEMSARARAKKLLQRLDSTPHIECVV